MHIDNLYRRPEMLQCFALEKVDGTSAHISWKKRQLYFSSGGATHDLFVGLFDREDLVSRLKSLGHEHITVFGEAFGGSVAGMSATYGTALRFLVFDVKIGDLWLDVPSAVTVTAELGLGFVPHERGPLTIEWLDQQRDRLSLVAVVADAIREGVVVRPIYEMQTNNGERVIFKHKRPEFRETKTFRPLDPERVMLLSEAAEVADEWVTPRRLQHVLQKTPYESVADTGAVIVAMLADVRREGEGEIVWSKDVEKAIGRAAARMLHSKQEAVTCQT